MTYNVHHYNPPAIKGLIDAGAIADFIKSNKADIVFLQEIDIKTRRVDGINQSLELSRLTGLKYSVFFKAIDILGGDFNAEPVSKEMGIMFSRYTSSTSDFVVTFPNINPEKTNDYLFTRRIDKIKFISHKVIPGINASDHLPVIAVVEF